MVLLTIADAATRLGVSQRTIRRAIKDGRLPAVMIAGRYRIDPENLGRLIKGVTERGAQ